MLTHAGPKVLEFNCRFGDPEAQVLMARFQGDLLKTLWLTATGRLADAQFSFDPRTACCVVVCSEGYPGEICKGMPIVGLEDLPKASTSPIGPFFFHSGTKAEKIGKIVTNGGRIVGATALGDFLAEAARQATVAAGQISFNGAFYRKDIGHRVLNHIQNAKLVKNHEAV